MTAFSDVQKSKNGENEHGLHAIVLKELELNLI